jgi:predicted phosphodiesterase
VKIGIFGDIHGNLVALEAVLDRLRQEGVERMFCTGDVVGYGPSPNECIERIQMEKIPSVMGNHDEYATQLTRKDWKIRQEARTAILWTQQALTGRNLRWLAMLPRIVEAEGIQVVHGSHIPWPRWRYVLNRVSAAENFLFQKANVSFNGHSHVPLLVSHRDGLMPRISQLRDFVVAPGRQFLISVGSVGQARDGDARASAVTYDTEKGLVHLLRIPYDVDKVHRQILDAGLPEALAARLLIGK